MANLKDDRRLHKLLSNVPSRFTENIHGYCSLVHPNQRAAVTLLAVTTMTMAYTRRVGVEDVIHDPARRAEVLKQLITRNTWLELSLERPLRQGRWREHYDSTKASLRATFERRAYEIWGN